MKRIYPFFSPFVIIALLAATSLPTGIITKGDSVRAVFAGTTPCGGIIRPLHKISPETDCALVEWNLVLYHDPVSLKPITYKLTAINRFVVKETNMYSQPGTRSESEGKWAIIRDTKTNSNAVVYQLNPGNPQLSINFLKLSDDLLHLLDQDGKLMIGDAFSSYTLNRAK